jgi:hypothetical protein
MKTPNHTAIEHLPTYAEWHHARTVARRWLLILAIGSLAMTIWLAVQLAYPQFVITPFGDIVPASEVHSIGDR